VIAKCTGLEWWVTDCNSVPSLQIDPSCGSAAHSITSLLYDIAHSFSLHKLATQCDLWEYW